MNSKQFDVELKKRIKDIKNVLSTKSAEYSKASDKHYNFKRAASIIQKTPETALWGMFLKHYVSIQDIVENIELTKEAPKEELVSEKIGDAINYLILLETLIKERREESK